MERWKKESISIYFKAIKKEFKCQQIRSCNSNDDYIIIEMCADPSDLEQLKNINLSDSSDIPCKWTIGSYVNDKSSVIDIKYVPGCKVYQNEERTQKLQRMIDFWRKDNTLIKNDTLRTKTINELEELKECDKPILFHCSSEVTHGASGSPCINVENGKVVGIYTGAIPRAYYDALSTNQQQHSMYLENRLETAFCTNIISKSITDIITATERNSRAS